MNPEIIINRAMTHLLCTKMSWKDFAECLRLFCSIWPDTKTDDILMIELMDKHEALEREEATQEKLFELD